MANRAALSVEIRRKVIHFPALIIPFGLYFFPEWFSIPTLFVCTGLAVVIELLRFRFPRVQELFYRLFGHLLRQHEEKRLTGSTALMLGASICVVLLANFSPNMYMAPKVKSALYLGFSYLILGDAAAALIGKIVAGPKLFGNKTIAGSLACFIVCITIYLVSGGFFDIVVVWRIALAGAFSTTVLEAVPMSIDDNLRVAPPVTIMMAYMG